MNMGMIMGMGLGMDADPAGRPSMTMQEQMTMLDLQSEQVSDGKAATAEWAKVVVANMARTQ